MRVIDLDADGISGGRRRSWTFARRLSRRAASGSMQTVDGAPLIVKVDRASAGLRADQPMAQLTWRRCCPPHVAPFAQHMIEKVPPDLSRFLLAPMPGLLMRLDVAAGDKVEAGQPLAVVEAMKMENILRAEKAGSGEGRLSRRPATAWRWMR